MIRNVCPGVGVFVIIQSRGNNGCIKGYYEKCISRVGLTLVEVLIAVSILAFGMIPIFMTFTETRRVTTGSINEMKATSMASSMVAGIMRVSGRLIDPKVHAQISVGYYDEALPPGIGLASIGVPLAYPGFKRHVQVNLVNSPLLPDERFTNPWGRVVEIRVAVSHNSSSNHGLVMVGKPIYELKAYRELECEP